MLQPRFETDAVTPLLRVKMVCQVLQKFRFRSHGGVANPRGYHSVFVKNAQQVHDMGLRDLIHGLLLICHKKKCTNKKW